MASFEEVLSVIVTILLIASIVGAFLTILTFAIFSDLRTYPIKLVMYLCACIIVADVFFLLAFEPWIRDNEAACIASAALIHFGYVANFVWTFCIAFNFYQMIVRRNRESEVLEKWYHIFAWGIPAVACIGVGVADCYGVRNGAVCYITNGFAIFFAFFLPGLIIVSANAILFFFVTREIRETLAAAPKQDRRERRKEFRIYLSIFISIGLSWIFGFLIALFPVRVLQLIFLFLFSISTPLQGFLIFGSYCINAKVVGKWAGLFGKCIPCCLRWENLDSRTTTGRTTSNNASSSGRAGTSGHSAGSSMASRAADSSASMRSGDSAAV